MKVSTYKPSKFLITVIVLFLSANIAPRVIAFASSSIIKTITFVTFMGLFCLAIVVKEKKLLILLLLFCLLFGYVQLTNKLTLFRGAIAITFAYGIYKYNYKIMNFLNENKIFWLLLVIYTIPLWQFMIHRDLDIRRLFFGNLINVCLFFMLLCVFVDSKKMLERMSNVLILLGIINACVTIAQFFGGTDFFYQSYFSNYEYDYGPIEVLGHYSPAGLLSGRNYNAVFSFLPLSLLMFKDAKRYRHLRYIGTLIIAFAILITLSLSILFLVPIFGALCFFYRGDRRDIFQSSVGIMLLLAVVVFLFKDLYIERIGFSKIIALQDITKVGNMSAYIAVVKASIPAFLHRPVLGYGYTGFDYVAHSYFRNYSSLPMAIGSEHNMYVDILVRGGLTGALLWFLVFLKTFKDYRGIIRFNKQNSILSCIYPYYIFLILMLLKGFTAFPLYHGLTYLAIPLAVPYIYKRIASKEL